MQPWLTRRVLVLLGSPGKVKEAAAHELIKAIYDKVVTERRNIENTCVCKKMA